jgi:hypothetical protein
VASATLTSLLFFFLLFLINDRNLSQDLVYAKQMIYNWATFPTLSAVLIVLFSIFLMQLNIIHRFQIWKFTYLLKYICNTKINTTGIFTDICRDQWKMWVSWSTFSLLRFNRAKLCLLVLALKHQTSILFAVYLVLCVLF